MTTDDHLTRDPLGTVVRDGDRVGVRYERRVAHPREKVWRAITESSELRHWMPTDIVGERRSGAPVELTFWPDVVERYEIEEPTLPGQIITWDPPSVFEWTWDTDRLRFELSDDGDGTRLVLTTWFGDTSEGYATQSAAGYHACLANLRELLDTGSAPPLIDVDARSLEPDYAALVQAPAPAG